MTARDLAYALRGLIARAVVRASRDDRASQLVDVTVREGHERSEVEVIQPFGFASRAPAGGLVIVLAVGGDQGDLAALPVAAPSARLGGLQEGEAAIYGADGSRVHVKRDGSIIVTAARQVLLVTPTAELSLTEEGLTARLAGAAGAGASVEINSERLRAHWGEQAEIELTEGRARLRAGGATASASAAAAKLRAGGHFFAATLGGLVVSGPAAVGPDPDPDG